MNEARRQLGFVTQETNLFSGTIKDNLQFVKPDATDEEIVAAMQKASCTNLLARSKNGINTQIGEGGLKMSGGEKQRLSIARALIRNPRIWVGGTLPFAATRTTSRRKSLRRDSRSC